MSNDDFARVLAEAGEPVLAEADPVERALAEILAGLAELHASQIARWLRNEPSRTAAVSAWQQANAAAGIEGGDPERWPWMQPPRRPMCW